MKETIYVVRSPVTKRYLLTLVSDLHNMPCEDVIASMSFHKPDYICIVGDILHASAPGKSIYHEDSRSAQHIRMAPNANRLLTESSKISSVLFVTGNHELYFDLEDINIMKQLGIVFLDNSFIKTDELIFGGLSSPYNLLAGTGDAETKEEHAKRWKIIFDGFRLEWLYDFQKQDGCKILLSHHPEIYDMYLKKNKGIDLILSGHAHGGQINIFGKGLFAHGQGFFPKYTDGIYDNKLIVSRGLANTSKLPRINNPRELVYIQLEPV